jgi:hypothetical protein
MTNLNYIRRLVRSINLLLIAISCFTTVQAQTVEMKNKPIHPILSTEHGWVIARPATELAIHEFFKSGACPPAILMTYIYDPESNKWWSKAEISNRYPEITAALTAEPCTVPLRPSEVAATLGLKWPANGGPVLIYFAPLYDEKSNQDASIIFTPEIKKSYLARLALLNQFNALPKYKIVTPFQAELRRPVK